jgi:hypothetical protein
MQNALAMRRDRLKRWAVPASLSGFVALVACTPEQSAPASPATLIAWSPVSDASQDAPGSASATGPAAPTMTSALPPLPLAEDAAGPFMARPLPTTRRLGRGWVLPPLLDGPDRAVLVTPGQRGDVVESRTGRALASLPAEPHYVVPRAGAVVLRGEPLRVLRLRGAALDVIEPALSAESGAKIHDRELVAMADRPRILALAEGPGGEKLMGPLSTDLTRADLAPTELRAADDNVYSFDGNVKGGYELYSNTHATAGYSGTPFSLPHGDGCVRLRVDDDGGSRCLEYRPMLSRDDAVQMLEGGWFFGHEPDDAHGWEPTFLSRVGWNERRFPLRTLLHADHCTLRHVNVSPPRALLTCTQPSVAALWSPEHLEAIDAPPGSTGLANDLGLSAGPVVPLVPELAGVRPGHVATLWLDTVNRRVFESPPLNPLAWNPDSGIDVRSLARDDADEAVWLLDFEQGSRTKVEGRTACPGPLHDELPEGADPTRFRGLLCFAPPAKGRIESRVLWSQIFDLRDRVVYRTTLQLVSWHADGTVVLTTASEIRGEGPASFGDVVAADLGT